MRVLSCPRFSLCLFLFLVLSCSAALVAGCTSTDESAPLPYTPEVWEPVSPAPQLPVGMNLNQHTYWSPSIPFTDAMTTASEMLTSNTVTYPWDSGKIGEIGRDANGYPEYLPWRTSDGADTFVRFLINNFYRGKYRIFFDGKGTLGGHAWLEGGNYYVTLDGTGENRWIDILTSTAGDPVRNIRIVPVAYEAAGVWPRFQKAWLDGLRPFHAFRFMDWINTNASTQTEWVDRVTPAWYTQGGERGICFEYAIEVCNELDADAWVCVPAMASDDYIRQLARLWRDNLEAGRRIYLEYSNEVWNWMFTQASWVVNNAPGAADAYVSADLAAIAAAGEGHPEKDAYMMARTFRLWREEFGADASSRIVNVATGQHAWPDNSRRILDYLFTKTTVGCDAFAVGGYFNFTEAEHARWNAAPEQVTADIILDETARRLIESDQWTRASAAWAAKYGIPFLVYEGGQHMQPWMQGEWGYNAALFEAQIHPKMYQLYLRNFRTEAASDVNCQLFMAFNYLGARKSRWGSWGHLESLDMVGPAGTDYTSTAPKYQALLDCNTPR